MVDLKEAPRKIPYEIVDNKELVLKKGKMSKKQLLLLLNRAKPVPRAFFMTHVITTERKEEKIPKKFLFIKWTKKKITKATYRVRWNYFWSEALKDGQTIPDYSVELENTNLGDYMIQLRNAISKITGLDLDQLMKLSILVFVMGLPLGIILNLLLNTIPTVVVTWIP